MRKVSNKQRSGSQEAERDKKIKGPVVRYRRRGVTSESKVR